MPQTVLYSKERLAHSGKVLQLSSATPKIEEVKKKLREAKDKLPGMLYEGTSFFHKNTNDTSITNLPTACCFTGQGFHVQGVGFAFQKDYAHKDRMAFCNNAYMQFSVEERIWANAPLVTMYSSSHKEEKPDLVTGICYPSAFFPVDVEIEPFKGFSLELRFNKAIELPELDCYGLLLGEYV